MSVRIGSQSDQKTYRTWKSWNWAYQRFCHPAQYWELNFDPLQEKQALLTAQLSLHHQLQVFILA